MPPEKKPEETFIKESTVLFTLECEEIKIENVFIKIIYRFDKPDLISGKIQCNLEEYNRIIPIFNKHKPFRLKSELENHIHYFSDRVYFKSSQVNRGLDEVKIDLQLHHYYFKITDTKEQVRENRFMIFQLTPPYVIWSTANLKNNDNPIFKYEENKNTFYYEKFKIHYYQEFVEDDFSSKENYTNIQKLRTFIEITEEDKSDLNDDNLRELMIKIIKDTVLLSSFLSGHRIIWNYSFFCGSNYLLKFFKAYEEYKENSTNQFEILIKPTNLTDFLNVALKKYIELNKNEILFYPIVEYLTFHKDFFLEQLFVIVYLCFEKIVSELYSKTNSEKILRKAKFKIIKEKLENDLLEISDSEVSTLQKELIMEKISELNRISIKRKIKFILENFNIEFSSALSDKGEFKFLKIRNELIHVAGDRKIDSDVLFQETYRLKGYFELIILKLLECDPKIIQEQAFTFFNEVNKNK